MNMRLYFALATAIGLLLGMITMGAVLGRSMYIMEVGLTELHQMEIEDLELELERLTEVNKLVNVDKEQLEIELENTQKTVEWMFEERERAERALDIIDMYKTKEIAEEEIDKLARAFEDEIFEAIGVRW